MKKKIFAILSVAVILLTLSIPAFAEETPTFQSPYSYVVSGYTMSGATTEHVKMYPVPNSGIDNGSSTVRLRNGQGVKIALINMEKIERWLRANPYGWVNYSVFTDWYYTVALSNNVVYYSWHRESTISDENGTCPQTVDGSTSWNVDDTDGDGYYLDFEIVDGGTVLWINSSSGNKNSGEKPGLPDVVDFIVQPFTWNDNENPIDASGEVVTVESVLAGAGQNLDGTSSYTSPYVLWNGLTYGGGMQEEYGVDISENGFTYVNHVSIANFEIFTGEGQYRFALAVYQYNNDGTASVLNYKSLNSGQTWYDNEIYNFTFNMQGMGFNYLNGGRYAFAIMSDYGVVAPYEGSSTFSNLNNMNILSSWSFEVRSDENTPITDGGGVGDYVRPNPIGDIDVDISNIGQWITSAYTGVTSAISEVSRIVTVVFSFLPSEFLAILLLALSLAVILAIVRGLRGA